VLAQARKSLYLILAEDEPATAGTETPDAEPSGAVEDDAPDAE
jgi:hypothetical protein